MSLNAEGKAREWYQKSADLGNADVKKALARLQPGSSGQEEDANQSPGPVYRDAEDWASRYRNAPRVFPTEFLQRVSEVGLVVETGGLKGVITADELAQELRPVLEAQGLRIIRSRQSHSR